MTKYRLLNLKIFQKTISEILYIVKVRNVNVLLNQNHFFSFVSKVHYLNCSLANSPGKVFYLHRNKFKWY